MECRSTRATPTAPHEMRYTKKDAETVPAKHTVYLDAADMEKAAIMYVRHLWGECEEIKSSPTDTAVLALGSPKDEQDHRLVWHTTD